MRRILIYICFSVSFLSCQKENKYEETNLVAREKVEQSYLAVTEVLSKLKVNLEHRNLPISLDLSRFLKLDLSKNIHFLKLTKSTCEPCVVDNVVSLKKFKKINLNSQVVLFVSFTSEKEEVLFKQQFNLEDLEVINLKDSELCSIDSLHTNYFGLIENLIITEVLPTHSMLNEQFIYSFLALGISE